MTEPGRTDARTETSPRDDTSFLARLIETAELGTWEADLATGTAIRSERALRFLGLSPAEARGLDAWRSRIHPADRAAVELELGRAHDPAGAGRYRVDYRVVHPDAGVRWLADRGWVEFAGDGESRRAVRSFGVVADITPRKRAEQRLALEHDVSRALTRAAGLDEAVPGVLAAIRAGMDAGFCALWLPDDVETRLRCVHVDVARDAGHLAPFVAASRERTFVLGEGLPGRVWKSGRAVRIPSLAIDPNFPRSPVAVACGLRSGLAMPVLGDRRILGVIEWFCPEPMSDDPELLATLDALGAEIGQFVLRARAERARRDSDERHQALYEATRALSETLDVESIYQRMREFVSRTLPVDGLVVSSFDPASGLIRCEHAWADGQRLDPDQFPAVPFNPGGGMQSEVIHSGEPRVFRDVRARTQNPRGTFFQATADGTIDRITEEQPASARCAIMVPLKLEGRVTGVVQVMSDQPDRYGERELELLTGIVRQLGVALQNARLYRRAMAEVAERKHAEEALRRSEQALRDADRRKDEFLATLAHELRNPLAPVRNSLEWMKLAGGDAEEHARARATMERQIAQMVRLIDDLLDVSRITRNRLELRRRTVDLAPVVLHAVEATRPLFEQARHELHVSLPRETVRLDADPERLTQVFGNLLTNACKYTEPGGRVELDAERRGDTVVVRVRDTGIGIPGDRLLEVFELFAQVDRSLERSQGGLGIGLSLVKRIVEMHDGRVRAESAGAGHGSTFVVELPVRVEGAPGSSTTAGAGEGAAAAAKARGRILVVDDNVDGAESLAILLRASGATVVTAHDGPAAVETAAEFLPEIILLDLGLPKLNGYEACRAIRAGAGGRPVVIVALTGWGQDEDRRRSAEAGFDGHLVKPVEFGALAGLLEELGGSRGR